MRTSETGKTKASPESHPNRKRTITIILSAAVIAAVTAIILYETLWLARARLPYKIYYFPLWEIHNNTGFAKKIETDELSPFRYPKTFPEYIRNSEGKELISYPAVFCKKCSKPFPFYTESFSPDDKPEKCGSCGNADPETLIVLMSSEMIIEYGLRDYFFPFMNDEFIKSIGLWEKVMEAEGKEKK